MRGRESLVKRVAVAFGPAVTIALPSPAAGLIVLEKLADPCIPDANT
jgi:hypothetical protein